MTSQVDGVESANVRLHRRLSALLFVSLLAFWGFVFSRSILSLDDMVYVERGRAELSTGGASGLLDVLHYDVVVRNGRIADTVLSLVAAMGGEPLARAYFALACALLFPTALIWLTFLLPRSIRGTLPAFALPVVAATAPWLLLALDRRLIPDLVLFAAASSGYFTGLFLVTLGLLPLLNVLNGGSTSGRVVALSAVPLFFGVLFHEVLAGLVLGSVLAIISLALRRRSSRRELSPFIGVMLAAVVLKASTPGLWSRAADSGQRQLGDAPLLDRTDVAIAFAVVAFVPLLGFLGVSIALLFPHRGVSIRRLGMVAMVAFALAVAGLGYRFLDGYPLSGGVTALAVVLVVSSAIAMRPARMEPVELVVCGAMLLAFTVPVWGGLFPGRAWFFGEFLAVILALSWFVKAAAEAGSPSSSPAADAGTAMPGARFLAVALLGSGMVVAPVMAYEMMDKVNDNYAWRAFVADQLQGQGDGTVEIPWTYPWDDMRPSFAIDREHEAFEDVVRTYFGIPADVELVWNGAVDWTAE